MTFTAQLLHLISHRLPRAIKSIPLRWDSVQRVLDIGYQRWEYLEAVSKSRQRRSIKLENNAEDNNAPRKLNILIMGGSVLAGTLCGKTINDMRESQE